MGVLQKPKLIVAALVLVVCAVGAVLTLTLRARHTTYATEQQAVFATCHADSVLGGQIGDMFSWTTADQAKGFGWLARIQKTSDGRYRVLDCKAQGVAHG
jgi:hypothetical protein